MMPEISLTGVRLAASTLSAGGAGDASCRFSATVTPLG